MASISSVSRHSSAGNAASSLAAGFLDELRARFLVNLGEAAGSAAAGGGGVGEVEPDSSVSDDSASEDAAAVRAAFAAIAASICSLVNDLPRGTGALAGNTTELVSSSKFISNVRLDLVSDGL